MPQREDFREERSVRFTVEIDRPRVDTSQDRCEVIDRSHGRIVTCMRSQDFPALRDRSARKTLLCPRTVDRTGVSRPAVVHEQKVVISK